MPRSESVLNPDKFTNFGDLLHHLRRQAHLTQTELGLAVGYSNGQISRLEQNRRLPDQASLTALFVPALNLANEPAWVGRLLQLAAETRRTPGGALAEKPAGLMMPAAVTDWLPRPAPFEVPRAALQQRITAQLFAERHLGLRALAGMGKTTLAAAVARDYAARAPVFWITLTAGINTTVDAIARQLAACLAAHGQAQVGPLLKAVEAALPFSQQMSLLSQALNRLTDAAGQTPPPLLCFDSVHLLQTEPAALQMLRHLMASTPALFLLTSRMELPLPEVAQIPLAGLAQAEGVRLIQQLAAARSTTSPLDPLLTAHLLDKTGGSPMLLRLALGHLLDRRSDLAGFVTQLEVHPQVAGYLLDTVRRQLSDGAWRLLCQVSVFRQSINLYDEGLVELIQARPGAYDIAAAIAELQRCQVIDSPAQATLHPLVRDYVYASLSADPPQRRRLHLLAGEWTGRRLNDSLRAARHYVEAGAVEQAAELLMGDVPILIRQGHALSAVAIIDEALDQARRARQPAPEMLRKLSVVRAHLLAGSPRQNEAEADDAEALTLGDAPEAQAELAATVS